jgi:hypothetical protein
MEASDRSTGSGTILERKKRRENDSRLYASRKMLQWNICVKVQGVQYTITHYFLMQVSDGSTAEEMGDCRDISTDIVFDFR